MKKLLKRIPLIEEVNSIIKASLQEQKARLRSRRYYAEAAKKNIISLESDELKQSLRRRLVTRRSGYPPKRKGHLHIFLPYCVSNWEAILPRVLEPFGKVKVFDWRTHGFDDERPDWLRRRDQMNMAMLDAYYEANSEEPIDVVVGYLSGRNTNPETLHEMARSGSVIFNFCWDDKLHFPGKERGGRYDSPAAIAQAVDLNLTNAPDSVVKYAVHGGLAMFWPEAAHPDIHRPYDLPFEFDISFVGACYGWRPAFIRRLNSALGTKVECFGKGWSNGYLSGEEVVKLYSRSRINLGFAGVGHSTILMCLKGRDFEIPMSGGLYLTQDNPELSLVYDVGEEIVTYKDLQDCVGKIKWLLENPTKAEGIRQSGRKRALQCHSWEKRFGDLFEFSGLLIAHNS